MKYTRFEDLPVWQDGMRLLEGVFDLTEDRAFNGMGDVRNQFQRAALSICNNIAEGFERGTTNEVITFLYIARGSAGEVRSMLLFAERRDKLAHVKSQISDLKSLGESISRQLRAWADSLQNSEIRGQRYLTDATRNEQERRQSRDTFLRELDEIVRATRQRDEPTET